MKVVVDGVEYLVGAHHSGPMEYTDIRFTVVIDGTLYFLDDVDARKYNGEDNHLVYTKDQPAELVAEVKQQLAENICKILAEIS
jgi:hypothetical protein